MPLASGELFEGDGDGGGEEPGAAIERLAAEAESAGHDGAGDVPLEVASVEDAQDERGGMNWKDVPRGKGRELMQPEPKCL